MFMMSATLKEKNALWAQGMAGPESGCDLSCFSFTHAVMEHICNIKTAMAVRHKNANLPTSSMVLFLSFTKSCNSAHHLLCWPFVT